jgi:CheY-like chemotaxis protein
MASILIVDDDEDDLAMFCEVVRELEPSINCIITRNCREALKCLRLHYPATPALIVMDLHLPGIDGLECLAEIKKDESFQNIPVVIYTGSIPVNDQTKGYTLVAKYYLEKPNNLSNLRAPLREILEQEMILHNMNN